MTDVAVLAGGRSPEREVSLRSGHRVSMALRERGFDAAPIDPSEPGFLELLATQGVTTCYVALHGREGEDGTVQRLLEAIEMPYTGSRPATCRVAFDKIALKETLEDAGIATPPWASISTTALRDLGAGPAIRTIADRLGMPLVVKPARGGSAMGLSFVDDPAGLPQAIRAALAFSDAAVIERRIAGVEVAGGLIASTDLPLPLVEIVPRSGVFDYAARYTPGATEYFAPARLGADLTAAADEAARGTFEAVGVRDVARADLLVDADGTAWVIDLNISPGMTDTSLLPMSAAAVGISFDELCERVLRAALDRSGTAVHGG